MNERYRYRDFYDFGMVMEKYKLDLAEIAALLQRKEIRKPLLWKNILKHWQLAKKAKQKDAVQILVTKELDDQSIENFLKMIPLE